VGRTRHLLCTDARACDASDSELTDEAIIASTLVSRTGVGL
jgi:hypothetical protein